MEVKIGIQNVTREATLNVNLTAEEVTRQYADARSADGMLSLTDETGRQIVIPAATIGYIEFGQEHARPVGFGA